MPALTRYAPDSLRSRLRAWLALHPGWHTSRTIATDLGIDTPKGRRDVNIELRRLSAERDAVITYRPADAPPRGPGSMYARPGTPPPAA